MRFVFLCFLNNVSAGSVVVRSDSESVWRPLRPKKEFWKTAEQVAELNELLISNAVRRNGFHSVRSSVKVCSDKGDKDKVGFVGSCGDNRCFSSSNSCNESQGLSVSNSFVSEVSDGSDEREVFLKPILKKQWAKSFDQRAKHVSFAVGC